MKCFIGFGKFYRFYIYILYSLILKYLNQMLFSFNFIKEDLNIGLFGFTPVLSKHTLIKSIYRYLGFIIFSIIFFYFFIIRKNKKENNIIKTMKKKRADTGLIYNDIIEIKTSTGRIQLLKVCLFYVFFFELNKIAYSFGFHSFDLWTFNIIFTILFIKYYFTFNQYSHQLYSLIFIFFTDTIFLIISSFFPNKEDDKDPKNINAYKYTEQLFKSELFCIPIYFAFMLNSILVSFSRVNIKVLMEIKYISTYKIIYVTGFFGLFISSILLTFTTIFKCEGTITNICKVSEYENNESNKDKYDDLFIYFSNLNYRLKNENVKFLVEILLIIPIYLFVNFIEFLIEISIIFYLNPIYLLVRDCLYYGTKNIISFILNFNSNPLNITRFVFMEIPDILCFLGYLIYLEIIELRFCGLNKNLKREICERAENDVISRVYDSENNDDIFETNNFSYPEEDEDDKNDEYNDIISQVEMNVI